MNIAAISTAPGIGGIAVIRVSGPNAIDIVSSIFTPSKKDHQLDTRASHTLTYGQIIQPDGSLLDEVVISLYKSPHSFTGENVIEISCHGSLYVQPFTKEQQDEIIRLFQKSANEIYYQLVSEQNSKI